MDLNKVIKKNLVYEKYHKLLINIANTPEELLELYPAEQAVAVRRIKDYIDKFLKENPLTGENFY